jgi:glutathione-independent formaldehyde dehydrogenase
VADGEPLLRCGAIDLALNREDRVDATDRFNGERRLAQIRQLKEFAPGVAPAGRLGDRAGSAPGIIKIARHGQLRLRFGLGWAKSHSFHTGQTPVLRYNRQLMEAIVWNRLPTADIINVKVISLDEAPEGYRSFDAGAPDKFVIDPHGLLSKTP